MIIPDLDCLDIYYLIWCLAVLPWYGSLCLLYVNSFYFYINIILLSAGTMDVIGGSRSLLMYQTEER